MGLKDIIMFCRNKNYETPYMVTVTVRVV